VDRPLRILYEVTGMVIGLTHRYLPLMVLPLVNAIEKIDRTLLTASTGLGASALRTQVRIVLPLSIPGAVAGVQLVFAGVLSDFVLPSLMGTTRFRMAAPAIYDEAIANVSWATAASMGVVVLLVVVLMLTGTNLALRRLAPWARTL
jgi:putative spermidine/putrescine transport system permease protein